MPTSAKVFERDTTLDELHSGVTLRAGRAVVLYVGGAGHGTGDGGPDADEGGGTGSTAPADEGGGTPEVPGDSTGAQEGDQPNTGAESAEPTPHDALDVQVVSAAGAPIKNVEWEVSLPDGSKRAGHTDGEGKLRVTGLAPQAACTLDLPDFDHLTSDTPATPGHVRYTQDLAVQAGTSTIVQLPPRVQRGELTGMHFETAKTFLLPSAMPGIRQLRTLYEAFGSELAVLVSGHTDTVGTADYNRGLSNQRAASIASFLSDDADGWMKFYDTQPDCDRWGVREDQYMLNVVGGAALTVDGSGGPATSAAYKAYQTSKGLPASGTGDAATRRALVTDYQAQDGTTLPKDARLASHGCGFTHLKKPTGPGVAEAENRRVEIYLFEAGVTPPPVDPCPPGGCAEYPQWAARVSETFDLDKPPGSIRVKVVDASGNGLDQANVHASGPVVKEQTTAGGEAAFSDLFPGSYKVVATAAGFDAADTTLEVTSGAEASATLTLQALLFDLDVLVEDGATPPKPLRDATVTIDVPGAQPQLTGPSGKVRFAGLKAGKVHVKATRKGFADTEADVQVGPGGAPTAPAKSGARLGLAGDQTDGATPGDAGAGDPQGGDSDVTLQMKATAPVIASFGGVAKGVKPAPAPSDFVFFPQGQGVTLSWAITGAFDQLLLQPGGQDVTQLTSLDVDPIHMPPDENGAYTLTAINAGLSSPPSTVTIAGVVKFTLSKALYPPEPDQHVYDKDGKTEVDHLDGQPGSFRDARFANGDVIFGQVTPKSFLTFAWTVTARSALSLELEVDHQFKQDVTNAADSEWSFDDKAVILLRANLNLRRTSTGKLLGSSVIVVRENLPAPGIEAFNLLDKGTVLAADKRLSSWDNLSFLWKLKGDFLQNRLEVIFRDEKGKELGRQVLRPADDPTAVGETKASGSPIFGHVTVEWRLVTKQKTAKGDELLAEAVKTSDYILAAPPPKQDTFPGTVKVLDADGKPVEGAQVDVTGPGQSVRGKTDAQGEAHFSGLTSGQFHIEASEGGRKAVEDLEHDSMFTDTLKLPALTKDVLSATLTNESTQTLNLMERSSQRTHILAMKFAFQLDSSDTSIDSVDKVTFEILRQDGSVWHVRHITSGDDLKVGGHDLLFDGWSQAGVFDTAVLKEPGLKARVTVEKEGHEPVVAETPLQVTPSSRALDFFDLRADEPTKSIVLTVRAAKDKFFTVSDTERDRVFNLFAEGVHQYWSHPVTLDGASWDLDVQVVVDEFGIPVEVDPKPPSWIPVRSCNLVPVGGHIHLLVGPKTSDNYIRDTAGHEVGHSVLKAAHDFDWSITHKHTSTVAQSTRSDSPDYSAFPGEIDIMLYLNGTPPHDMFKRDVFIESDRLDALWVTEVAVAPTPTIPP
ncbi:MAG: carboxypeptidase regulatory-like domain-containing protein [Deltaproteobacteria bacterium]|nr:carboxypeptidase regulatory-like domain-containing protein [Deltaproteobacteria bacterium]